MIQSILVPVDGSASSDRAVAQAISIATLCESKLNFLYVANINQLAINACLSDAILAAVRKAGEVILDRAVNMVPSDIKYVDFNDLFYENNGELVACESNPVKLDAETARCAGKFFEFEDNYVRPSQDCGKAYGEKLNFNKVVSLSKLGYSEELIKTVSHKDIKLGIQNNYVGIHTYNKLENVEVVDLKIKGRFNIYNFCGIIYKLFKRVF